MLVKATQYFWQVCIHSALTNCGKEGQLAVKVQLQQIAKLCTDSGKHGHGGNNVLTMLIDCCNWLSRQGIFGSSSVLCEYVQLQGMLPHLFNIGKGLRTLWNPFTDC